jgi:hypothetical protein
MPVIRIKENTNSNPNNGTLHYNAYSGTTILFLSVYCVGAFPLVTTSRSWIFIASLEAQAHF